MSNLYRKGDVLKHKLKNQFIIILNPVPKVNPNLWNHPTIHVYYTKAGFAIDMSLVQIVEEDALEFYDVVISNLTEEPHSYEKEIKDFLFAWKNREESITGEDIYNYLNYLVDSKDRTFSKSNLP